MLIAHLHLKFNLLYYNEYNARVYNLFNIFVTKKHCEALNTIFTTLLLIMIYSYSHAREPLAHNIILFLFYVYSYLVYLLLKKINNVA